MQNNQSDMQGGRLFCAYPQALPEASGLPVSAARLKKMAVRAGQHYRITTPGSEAVLGRDIEGSMAVMNGQVVIQDAGDALMVHTTDAVAAQDWVAEIDLPAGLIFCFIEEGELGFKLDAQDYLFEAVNNQSEGCGYTPNNCFLLNLEKPARLKRYIVAGVKNKKLNVTASRTWMSKHLLSSDGSSCCGARPLLQPLAHGEVLRWRAQYPLTQIAKQLLSSSLQAESLRKGGELLADNSPLGSLLLQGQATQCLALALNEGLQLQREGMRKPKVNALQQRFMVIIERYVNSSGDSTAVLVVGASVNTPAINIRSIANELGMSVSAVQRLAKQVLGDSLVNYIRAKKLNVARKALEAGTLSIGEVAYQAGYKHSSNFAIAFKKAFGVAPGAVRCE